MRPMTLIWIALGGALGAVLRYLSGVAALRLWGPDFPWGTLFVNVAGGLAMGFAAALILERTGVGRAQLFVMTGLLGGFTTFSAFALETLVLIERGRMIAAVGYVGGSVLLSLAALALGLVVGRHML